MYIDPHWRILTIGDGDLSFSRALHDGYAPAKLEASVFDDETTLLGKYQHNELSYLRQLDIPVHTEVDITDPSSIKSITKTFDVIIFQFPLITRCASNEEFNSRGPSLNTNLLNRRLLRHFLIQSFDLLLDRDGAQLCFITSKDVKPFYDWNIENSINRNLDIPYLGSMPFELDQFPGYRIRNVERDKIIADTGATTYVWGHNSPVELTDKLSQSIFTSEDCCSMCRAGPFTADENRIKHLLSKRHKMMQAFEEAWANDIADEEPIT